MQVVEPDTKVVLHANHSAKPIRLWSEGCQLGPTPIRRRLAIILSRNQGLVVGVRRSVNVLEKTRRYGPFIGLVVDSYDGGAPGSLIASGIRGKPERIASTPRPLELSNA